LLCHDINVIKDTGKRSLELGRTLVTARPNKTNKKLSYCREAARRSVLLKIVNVAKLYSSLFETAPLSTA